MRQNVCPVETIDTQTVGVIGRFDDSSPTLTTLILLHTIWESLLKWDPGAFNEKSFVSDRGNLIELERGNQHIQRSADAL